MRPDDINAALEAMASAEPAPGTNATAVIARGRRRIVRRRLALVGIAAALIAVVATAGTVAHAHRDTNSVTAVPTTSTTLAGRAIPPPPPTRSTTPTSTPEPAPRTPSPLAFAGANEDWICGDSLTYTTDGFNQFEASTRDVKAPSGAPALLGAGYQPPLCTAVTGGNAWLLRGTANPHRPEIVRFRGAGADVKVFPFATIAHPNSTVSSLDFVDANNGWALVESSDGSDLYRTGDGAATWQLLVRDAPISGQIDFASTSHGWSSPNDRSANLSETTDGGLTWHDVTVRTKRFRPKYTGVSPALVTGNLVVAYGQTYTGNLFWPFFDVSTDGGRTWSLRSGPKNLELPGTLANAFSAADADHWALGWANHLYLTDDGGRTWTERAQFAGLDTIHYLVRSSADNVVVSGIGNPSNGSTVVLATLDSGDTWTTVNYSAPPLPANAKVMNFPGGIIGCPAHALTPVPARDPPPGLEAAAFDYARSVRHWEPAAVTDLYRIGTPSTNALEQLFTFQVSSCSADVARASWMVEVHGVSGAGGGGSTERVQLALAHSADGWHVFGFYH